MIKRKNLVKVNDNAMSPIINLGDKVIFKTIEFKKIKVNDIVCLKKGDEILFRRVVYRKNNYVITKADANRRSDGKCYKNSIVGVIIAKQIKDELIPIDAIYYFQSSIYWSEINKINLLFQQKGINFVFLKGLPVYLLYEKKIPRRLYADCDMLVGRKDISKAQGLLKNLGYRKKENFTSFQPWNMKRNRSEEEWVIFIKGTEVNIDLHFEAIYYTARLTNPLLERFSQSLLDNKRDVRIKAKLFPILSYEYQIIYLFLHLFQHNFSGSYRYELLKNILKKHVDISAINSTISKFKLANYIFPGILLLKKNYADVVTTGIKVKVEGNLKYKYLLKRLKNKSIFDENYLPDEIIYSLILLFCISPQINLKKILIFFNFEVLYKAVYIIWMRVRK